MAEHFLFHAAVKVPQQRHDLLRRHLLGHGREAHQVGEEHADRLPAHAAQRLVSPGERVHHLGREVAGEVAAGALGLGPLGHQRARAPDQERQAGTHQQEHDHLVLVLEDRGVVRIEVGGEHGGAAAPAGRIGDGPGPRHDPEKADRPGADAAQSGPQEERRSERERGLHEEDEEVHETGVAERHRQRQLRGGVRIRQQEDGGQRQRVQEYEQIGRQPQSPAAKVEPELSEPGHEEDGRGAENPGESQSPLGVRHREPPQDDRHRRRARGGRHHQAPPLLAGEGSV